MLPLPVTPTYLFGPLFLLLVVGCGLLLVWIAEASPLASFFRRRAQVVAPYAGSLAILFSLFIVFTTSDIWSQRDKAEAAVGQQADAIRLIRVVAAGLGDQGEPLGRLVAEYGRAQTAADWREPQGQQAVERLQRQLYEQVLFGDAAGADDLVRHTTAEAILTVVDSHRQLFDASTSRTGLRKWTAAAVLAVLAQMALVLVHLGRPQSSAIANVLFSIGAAFVLWVTLARLDPFEGVEPISLQPIAVASQSEG